MTALVGFQTVTQVTEGPFTSQEARVTFIPAQPASSREQRLQLAVSVIIAIAKKGTIGQG